MHATRPTALTVLHFNYLIAADIEYKLRGTYLYKFFVVFLLPISKFQILPLQFVLHKS